MAHFVRFVAAFRRFVSGREGQSLGEESDIRSITPCGDTLLGTHENADPINQWSHI